MMLVSWLKTTLSGKTRMSWPLQSEPRQIGKGWGREEDRNAWTEELRELSSEDSDPQVETRTNVHQILTEHRPRTYY